MKTDLMVPLSLSFPLSLSIASSLKMPSSAQYPVPSPPTLDPYGGLELAPFSHANLMSH